MKITMLECLHADAGQRDFDFLKISTDAGLVGWSEYNESFAFSVQTWYHAYLNLSLGCGTMPPEKGVAPSPGVAHALN